MPLCQICNLREATLFITRTVNGQKSQLAVCRQCAAESGIVKIDLNNLLAGLAAFSHPADEKESEEVVACPSCGMTLEEFNQTGRMGCSRCYQTFAEPMEQLFSRIHGHVRHTGKRPGHMAAEVQLLEPVPDTLQRLITELANAIREEAYEQAAELRDRIRRWNATRYRTPGTTRPPDRPTRAVPPAASHATGKTRPPGRCPMNKWYIDAGRNPTWCSAAASAWPAISRNIRIRTTAIRRRSGG
jgi:protein arginine kinase activator